VSRSFLYVNSNSIHDDSSSTSSYRRPGSSGTPRANQKGGASHFGAASWALTGIVAAMVAVAGGVIMA